MKNKKCPECGQMIEDESPAEEKKEMSSDKQSKKDMIVMILKKKGMKDAKG